MLQNTNQNLFTIYCSNNNITIHNKCINFIIQKHRNLKKTTSNIKEKFIEVHYYITIRL
mgnify:CR=1 FL=1